MTISKQILKEVLTDQQSSPDLADYVIPREIQTNISHYFPDDRISIISGIRRCGKSTLLQHIRRLQSEQDYYFNFDDDRLVHFQLKDFQTLYELFIEEYGPQSYFYFDEIQNIEGWERFVRRLHDQGNQVLVTGSNARMLSQELGTRLTGRYRQTELFPFSFQEFLTFHHVDVKDIASTKGKAIMQKHFNTFLNDGGIPVYVRIKDSQYLSDLYEGILYRDVVARYHITKVEDLKALVYHAASNISKLISYGKMCRMLGIKNTTTVKDYLHYLQQSYLIFLVPKFYDSTKRQILAPKKLYFIDTALAQTVGFRRSPDSGRLLENCVFLELRRRTPHIFYFQGKKECDFIAKDSDGKWSAIQVCQSMDDEQTRQREIDGLMEALDAFNLRRGLILTGGEASEITLTHNRKRYHIDVLPVWQWLMQ